MTANSWNKERILALLVAEMERLLQVSREKDLRQRPKIMSTTDIQHELAIDSLEFMDLVTAIERRFDVSIRPEELASKKTVGDVADHISHVLTVKTS